MCTIIQCKKLYVQFISVRAGGLGAVAPPHYLKNYVNRANFQKLSANTQAKMKSKQYRFTRLHTKRAMSNQKEIVFVNTSMSKVSITSKLTHICMSL